MATVKHTPGPWVFENPMGEDIGLWIVQGGLEAYQWSCIAVVTDDEDGTARDEGGRFIGRGEQRANARLIAQAPAMLEALKEAEDHMILMYSGIAGGNAEAGQRFADNDPVVAVIRNVIAAATGEAP